MEKNKRKPYRLKNYNYSQNGTYFITICTKDRVPILSEITVGTSIARPCELHLTNVGKIVDNGIKDIEKHYENIYVDNYVIMPNHIHLIIRINNESGRALLVPTISRIVQQFKGCVTKQLGKSIWQNKFYDHIIRDDVDYRIKYQYIDDNPVKWFDDEYFMM